MNPSCISTRVRRIAVLVFLAAIARGEGAVKTIDFNRDVRPILSENCFTCHGPDEAKRKGKLRLDRKDDAFAPAESGEIAIVPGKPDASELIKRATSHDADERMPPKKADKKPLAAAEIEVLRRWIAEGAEYKGHWAFIAPVRPAVPVVKDAAWPRNEVDRFLLAHLESKALKPSAEADARTLIRRMSLDLTGLPPTPQEVNAFIADVKPGAYERLADRLLASPRYGEKMAQHWLDGARYADSNGFQTDSERFMWRWRDWVINAFNANKPFDQFTIEQLAGDLLPNATLDQKIASGFNRNNRVNEEGGAIDAEWRIEYVMDRVETTSAVWLGLTMSCARCHDHKYDPITQREFYQFFSFFNNVDERGLALGGNNSPLLPLSTPEFDAKLAEVDKQLAAAREETKTGEQRMLAAQAVWEKTAAAAPAPVWRVLDPETFVSEKGATLTKEAGGVIFSGGAQPVKDTYRIAATTDLVGITAVRIELLPDDRLPVKGPGRGQFGNPVLSELRIRAGAKQGGELALLALRGQAADFNQKDYEVQKAVDGKPDTGWALQGGIGQPHFAVFEFQEPLKIAGGVKLTFSIDQNYGQGFLLGKLRLSVTTSPQPLPLPTDVQSILTVAAEKRDEAQKKRLREHFASTQPTLAAAEARIAELTKQRTAIGKAMPTTMVMQEMAKPRDAFILKRGEYDKPGEKVTMGVPAALPPLPAGAPLNRLGLAQWMIDPQHPLTARVAVNRMWEKFFGTGLVKTSENFGSQAEWPSNIELLDWLATEFIRLKWDVKAFQKMLVTSAAYRQSSRLTPGLIEADPENRLLARGPRFRLPAETIRDQALAISGLLIERVGGPSVRPYMPKGVWDETNVYGDLRNYQQAKDDGLYRRTLYTIWKRTAAPPTMVLFDAPSREICQVKRGRTNTPLQALALLNEVTYVEAARKLAERMILEGGATPAERIRYGFVRATGRPPTDAELAVLTRGLDRRLAEYRAKPDAAKQLIALGEAKADAKIDPAELAATTLTANVLLNLDETVTKE